MYVEPATKHEIGEDLCSLLRSQRDSRPELRRVGTFEGVAWTWDKEARLALTAFLVTYA